MKRNYCLSSLLKAGVITSALLSPFSVLEAKELPKPSELQLEWQKMETIAFIHFSINTFTDMEWGYGNESPKLFNPSKLDCRQWVATCKQAGLKGVILTAKHHDGFCLWPSEYTEHSVKNSPWRLGNGDLVKEFSDACKEAGLKMGLYLSPWDCNHPDYGKPEYNDYLCGQLEELLTNYGDIFEIWFDGANGGRGYYGTDSLHTRNISDDYYDWERISSIVKRLQPNCIIHGGAIADIRWVGNEEGFAGEEHWSTIGEFRQGEAVRHQLNRGHVDGTTWMPSETDVSIRPGWYYHFSEDHKLKSLSKMVDIYYESVGRNSLLLLNIPPNKDGLVHPVDSARLVDWYNQYNKELSSNLIGDKISLILDGKSIDKEPLIDGDMNTFIELNTGSYVEVVFPRETKFNRIMLCENITNGQSVKRFTIEALIDKKWQIIDSQTTIGYKRILRYPELSAKAIRVKLEESHTKIELSTLEIFNATVAQAIPSIRRDKDGFVRISNGDQYADIIYTTDGKRPSKGKGKIYKEPFMYNQLGSINAIAISGKSTSDLASREFKHTKESWAVVGDSLAGRVIFDENINTAWISPRNSKDVVIDFVESKEILKLKWTPDQARWARGIVSQYEIYVSEDGINWGSPVAKGEFGNIVNNPIEQEIELSQGSQGRYIRFSSLKTVGNDPMIGISELDFEFKE
ncbi:MAG: alpha-L-fucosidase [Bacteroidales bacterium]